MGLSVARNGHRDGEGQSRRRAKVGDLSSPAGSTPAPLSHRPQPLQLQLWPGRGLGHGEYPGGGPGPSHRGRVSRPGQS
jgi:hypothetical protein